MTSQNKKFKTRAPRYNFSAHEESYIRFSSQNNESTVMTRVLNISETGLGFLVGENEAPILREQIKLEFKAPGGQQIAWWGQVVRVAEYKPLRSWKSTVTEDGQKLLSIGISFDELPDGHQKELISGLYKKFTELKQAEKHKELQEFIAYVNEYKWTLLLYVSLCTLTVYLLVWLSEPTPTYDKDRGSPWGQRYKLFD